MKFLFELDHNGNGTLTVNNGAVTKVTDFTSMFEFERDNKIFKLTGKLIGECKMPQSYLKLTEAKAGQKVRLDGGFTCVKAGFIELHEDNDGIYFECKEGHHYIEGQADDGIHCVGMYAT